MIVTGSPPVAYSGDLPADRHDPHSLRILASCERDKYDITRENIRRSRQAYFANISYIDDKLGEVLDVLEATGQEAAILFTSDHGDMLGERGFATVRDLVAQTRSYQLEYSDLDEAVAALTHLAGGRYA